MALAHQAWSVTATATNALATATKGAVAGKVHHITDVVVSFGAAAGAGLLQVKDGVTVILEQYVKDTVPVVIPLRTPLNGTVGNAVSAELGAGGAGAIGKVNLVGWTD